MESVLNFKAIIHTIQLNYFTLSQIPFLKLIIDMNL